MDVIKGLFNLPGDMLYFVTGEGSWALRPHEKIVLEAVIDHLDTSAQRVLRSLLRQKMFVQRSNARIVRPRFYTSNYARLRTPINSAAKESQAYEVVIDVAGHRQRAHVEFFHGEIDSVQFAKQGDFYGGKTVYAVKVSEVDCSSTNAAQVDREEHGD